MIKQNKKIDPTIYSIIQEKLDDLFSLKEEIALLKKEIADRQEIINHIQNDLLSFLKETNQSKAVFSNGCISVEHKKRLQVLDIEKLYAFIKAHDAFDLLEKRVSKKAFGFYSENHDALNDLGVVEVFDAELKAKQVWIFI